MISGSRYYWLAQVRYGLHFEKVPLGVELYNECWKRVKLASSYICSCWEEQEQEKKFDWDTNITVVAGQSVTFVIAKLLFNFSSSSVTNIDGRTKHG